MSTGGEEDDGQLAVTPELVEAVRRMKARALFIRNLTNWMVVAGIVLALIPAFPLMVREDRHGLAALYILSGALCLGVTGGLWLAALLTRAMRPRCPNCGGTWRIISRADEKQFGKAGKCPHCGIPV